MKTWMLATSMLVLPSVAVADCAAEAKNLLAGKNCGFAKGISGWSRVGDHAASHEKADGDPEKGALAGDDASGSLILVGPCIDVQPNSDYRISAKVKVATGSLYVCGYAAYQGATCDDASEPLAATAVPPTATWTTQSGDARTSATAKAVRLRLQCSGESGFRVLFDDVAFAAK